MKLLFLFSGSLRTINKNIKTLENLFMHYKYDIYVYNSNDDDNKYNSTEIYKTNIVSKIKLILNENSKNTDFFKNLDPGNGEKIINTKKQWYKLYKLFEFVKNNGEYDFIIRMRPDIEILSNINDMNEILSSLEKNVLYVPNILMHDINIITKYNNYTHINDQFCIADYNTMKIYCSLYEKLEQYSEKYPFISEIILFQYLTDNNVNIKKINIDYKLNLSKCNVFAISGDSGVGKSTLMNSIESLFLFDNYIKFETDRYHKWERGNNNWDIYTHLDPHSNHLEKMHDDIFNLKIGNNIYAVDYDHNTGKFTVPEKIESTNGIILCGLHTLYNKKTLELIDIKIFVDTQEEIKKVWKLRRDILQRGYSFEKVIGSMNKRESDFKKYIDPQKNNADIIVKYYTDEHIDIYKYKEYDNMNVKFMVIISNDLYRNFKNKFENCKIFNFINNVNNVIVSTKYDNTINSNDYSEIKDYINSYYDFISIENIKNNCSCILQLLILLILY